MSGLRILVTGGSGFIGSHVCRRLARDHEVLSPSHAELDLTVSTEVADWLRRHAVDAVVHCAVTPGHRNAADPTRLLERNLRMFFNVVRSRHKFGRLVVLSSGAVYDVSRPLEDVPEDEAGDALPADEHGISKLVEAHWLRDDDDAVELRPFGVYGPGEDYAIRFISNACCKALFDLPITLRQDRRFAYVHVEDLAETVAAALPRCDGRSGDGEALPVVPPGAYNVVPDEPATLRAIAELVLRTARKDLPISVARTGMGPAYTGDGGRLKRVAPGLVTTPLETGVGALYAWYEERRDTLDRRTLLVDR